MSWVVCVLAVVIAILGCYALNLPTHRDLDFVMSRIRMQDDEIGKLLARVAMLQSKGRK